MGDKRILARLSLGPGPERLAGFEEVFEKRVAPLLVKHGLVDGFVPDRGGGVGVFSRVFELADKSEMSAIQRALTEDADWQELLGKLGKEFGTRRPDGAIQHFFGFYQTPAGPGKTAQAGPGHGQWETYDATDGLASSQVHCLTQGREGNLWFGTRGGVSCFDGQEWKNFTVADGLRSNHLFSVIEDRHGIFWFGGWGGVNRYDGREWKVYPFDRAMTPIFEDQGGALWLGANDGCAFRFEGEKWEEFTPGEGRLPGRSITSICEDRDGGIWFGTFGGGLCRYDGRNWKTFTIRDGLPDNMITSIVEDQNGGLLLGTHKGIYNFDVHSCETSAVADELKGYWVGALCEDRGGNLWFQSAEGAHRWDGETLTTFTAADGLTSGGVHAIFQDREGYVWFATKDGVSRYSGEGITTFTTDDGLGSNLVEHLFQDREGRLWIGSLNEGVTRYDGDAFTCLTTQDGLIDDTVWAMSQDFGGDLWFGTFDGLSRYDGESFVSFTTADGLGKDDVPSGSGSGQNNVLSMLRDSRGVLWFGTQRGGLSRYDGEGSFTSAFAEDLTHDNVQSVYEDREGCVWACCGAGNGVGRYDGQDWTSFFVENGLVSNTVWSMLQDRAGDFWFGTEEGVSRYDGEKFTSYTTDDGLALDGVWSVLEDRRGHLWFGTNGGGTSRFDGQVFQTLSRRDGLAGNRIHQILEDENGDLWFGTDNGLTRFRQAEPLPPPVYIRSVIADRRYEEVNAVEVADSVGLVAFEFGGVSLKTRPGAMVYRHRLRGYEEEWKNGHERRVEYQNLPAGEYSFEVVAVDRDLVYSEEPAVVELRVVHDARDEQIDELEERVWERTRELEETHRELEETQARLIDELEEELQTAHDMQMRLMPAGPPRIEGVEVAGRCIPANHVGGDLFQYFIPGEGQLTLAMADVTGHAMEAAIPVVMFSGILQNQMAHGDELEELFGKLNDSLHDILDHRTFVCFSMGEFDIVSGRFRLANAGCPYPYHFRASSGDIVELQVDAYPLGVRTGTVYRLEETRLEAGDWLVLCSDGIAEAENGAGDLFGFERTVAAIGAGCREGLSAEGLIERLLAGVKDFCGGAPQGDDQTIVAMKVGG